MAADGKRAWIPPWDGFVCWLYRAVVTFQLPWPGVFPQPSGHGFLHLVIPRHENRFEESQAIPAGETSQIRHLLGQLALILYHRDARSEHPHLDEGVTQRGFSLSM